MASVEDKESILFLDKNDNDGYLGFLKETLNDFAIKKVSSKEVCLAEIDKNNTKIILINDDINQQQYEYFLNQVKLTENAPSVVMISKEPKDVADVNSLYLAGLSSYLIKDKINWEKELISSIRHIIRNQKLEEINRKLTTRLTEANDLLNQKNNRLDDFCSTVAHDIRGPLGGLVMRLDYLKEDFEKIDKNRLKSLISSSLSVCERLVEQVQAMYEFAKLGKESANMDFFDLNNLVYALIDDFNFQEKDGIKISVEKLPTIWGNKELIRRVFLNLISNAIRYNDKEKKEIAIGTLGLEETHIGKFAKLYVKDNGNGILETDKKDIFKIFTRCSKPTSSDTKDALNQDTKLKDGLGVGLTVVERAIELHLGKIYVESKIKEGSKFIFTLPIEEIR